MPMLDRDAVLESVRLWVEFCDDCHEKGDGATLLKSIEALETSDDYWRGRYPTAEEGNAHHWKWVHNQGRVLGHVIVENRSANDVRLDWVTGDRCRPCLSDRTPCPWPEVS